MEKSSSDYIELVRQAQLGDKECPERLAEVVRERLYSYVYRCTMSDELTNDIVQESLLKMLEALSKLRNIELFWPWLYKIARNKMLNHYRKEQHHITISDPDMNYSQKNKDGQEAIVGMLYDEFREAVFASMQELKPDHRLVINMRCYDKMQYSEIGEVIGCSEFAAQKLFYRAKKSLKKKLISHGLGKGSMFMALVIFGKLTAPTEAAAAQITVTAATTKVGAAASVSAIIASKTVIVSLITAALAIGTVVVTLSRETSVVAPFENLTEGSYVVPQEVQTQKDGKKYWYYYPANAGNVVMMRVEALDAQNNYRHCKYLQNDECNYYFNKCKNTVNLNNYRQWNKDLSVWQLPTDSSKLTAFLLQIDGRNQTSEDVNRNGGVLPVMSKQSSLEDNNEIQITHHHNALGEDYFKYDWPADAKVVDNRDAMHKRGWTYFSVTGEIEGKEIEGVGRLPFVYAESRSHWPWMKLRVGSESYFDRSFIGLSRPWAGLHTIDV
ncbi:MAG TPA: sigma-70 family RNA polymerase sigma factor, partial [Sedimentisphaerales bacterium]|nr:sigma-70 family RNA polymerase sigma factor [Sedimentisphaerales bacterium]